MLSLALAAAFPTRKFNFPKPSSPPAGWPRITDVIADVSVIDRAQLDLAGQSSLRDLLSQLPGTDHQQRKFRSSTGLFLRGCQLVTNAGS